MLRLFFLVFGRLTRNFLVKGGPQKKYAHPKENAREEAENRSKKKRETVRAGLALAACLLLSLRSTGLATLAFATGLALLALVAGLASLASAFKVVARKSGRKRRSHGNHLKESRSEARKSERQ